jgi:transcriptional regulator with XRE-family HTH domain
MKKIMKTLNNYIECNPVEFRQEELILETTELIAKVMTENNISKSELAAKLGKSKPHVSQCLSGEQNLTLRTLADIFGVLGYRMQVGACPLDAATGKPIGRLYPIGGWSFEGMRAPQDATVASCVSSSAFEDDDLLELEEAAA